MAAFEIHWVHL